MIGKLTFYIFNLQEGLLKEEARLVYNGETALAASRVQRKHNRKNFLRKDIQRNQ